MTRAYGYIRTAREDQPRKVDLQRAAIERAAEELGIDVESIYFDDGVAGGRDFATRPAMANLIEQLRPGDCIIAASAEVLCRSAEGLLAFMDWAEARDIRWHWADMIGFDRPIWAFNAKDDRGVMHHVQVFLDLAAATALAKEMLRGGQDRRVVGDLISLKTRPTGLG